MRTKYSAYEKMTFQNPWGKTGYSVNGDYSVS